MVSMKEVAHAAGVSIGTVSGVLNGKTTIKPENYHKVMDAVERLGYQPNMVARSLRTNTSNSIGLIIPDITNPYYPELERGVEDVAKDAGQTLILCNSDRNPVQEWELALSLVQKQVDGIISAKPKMTREQLETISRYCKLVLVDGTEEELGEFDLVNVDCGSAARSALNVLMSHGHRKIAYIGGFIDSSSARQRLDAYLDVLKERGMECRSEWVETCSYSWRAGRDAALKILARNKEQPTAFFVANDIIALGVIRGLQDCGLRVPEDVSVCGFDDIALAELYYPALTTVRQPKYEIGRLSAQMLLQRISGASTEPVHRILDANVVFRDTVARVK